MNMAAHPITVAAAMTAEIRQRRCLITCSSTMSIHAAELDQVADKLRAEGKEAAADQIKKAVDEFKKEIFIWDLHLRP